MDKSIILYILLGLHKKFKNANLELTRQRTHNQEEADKDHKDRDPPDAWSCWRYYSHSIIFVHRAHTTARASWSATLAARHTCRFISDKRRERMHVQHRF